MERTEPIKNNIFRNDTIYNSTDDVRLMWDFQIEISEGSMKKSKELEVIHPTETLITNNLIINLVIRSVKYLCILNRLSFSPQDDAFYIERNDIAIKLSNKALNVIKKYPAQAERMRKCVKELLERRETSVSDVLTELSKSIHSRMQEHMKHSYKEEHLLDVSLSSSINEYILDFLTKLSK